MRCLLQRVAEARVRVAGTVVGEVGEGLLALVGIAGTDTEDAARLLARKTLTARLFAEGDRPFHLPLPPGGEVLVISQFTLYGDMRRGNRPSWAGAARPESARPLVELYCTALAEGGARVAQGRFGAHMEVESVNDGPVTVLLDSDELGRARRAPGQDGARS